MTRTRDMMLTEPGALMRRMFRDLDPWSERLGWPFAGLRKRSPTSRGHPRSR
jgi:hypothetical protein